jgi:hypothetical protein
MTYLVFVAGDNSISVEQINEAAEMEEERFGDQQIPLDLLDSCDEDFCDLLPREVVQVCVYRTSVRPTKK